jgi:thiamine kinase-like enzyme
MEFGQPKVYEIISYGERIGIIYDEVTGESLEDWVMKTGDIKTCAVYMANLHKSILQNKVNDVASYKEFLKYHIENAPSVSLENRNAALELLEELPSGNTLCHGDFHPGNILISNGHTVAIDFMNVCQGDWLYDVARTVFLVEYTPVTETMEEDKEAVLRLKKKVADLYLIEMNVTREMIEDYLSVIFLARKGECPDELLNYKLDITLTS